MKRKRKQFIAVILSGMMIFSTTGFAFADVDEEVPQTEPVKIEKEIEQPKTVEQSKEEKAVKEIVKEEPQKEETQQKQEVKKEEPAKEEFNTKENLKKGEEPKEEPQVKEEVVETEKVTIQFQVMKPDGNWANAGGGSSVIIKKGDGGSKTFTINANDKKDVTINGTSIIYHYLETWGDGQYDASSGKIRIEDKKALFNKYKKDGQAEVTVYIKADYQILKNYYFDINYIDNIGNGGGGASHYSNNTAYNHTFEISADIPSNYEFLYWKNKKTGDIYNADDTLTIEANSLEKDNEVINIYAVYNYQPNIELYYHDKNSVKDSGPKSEPIDIYGDSQAPKTIKHWFYDEEGGEPIPNGELLSLPDIIPAITEKVAKEDQIKKVNVYAHYHGVTFVDEDNKTILKDRVEYQYDTAAEDIEKPADPVKKATAQYTFFFNGWLPTIVNVVEEAIYQASYRSEINTYTVIWINEDGTELEKDLEVPYGEMPSYNGTTPKKAATSKYTYDFAGWTPTVETVTGNAVYQATYNATPIPVVKPDPDNPDPKNPGSTKTKTKTEIIWVPGENVGGDGYTPPAQHSVLPTTKTPFTAPAEVGAWAFLNLLAVLANFVVCIFLLLMAYINKRKEDDEDEEVEVHNRMLGRICTLIIAVVSGIIFLLTEDMSLPMVWVDNWTFLMICTFVLQLIVGFLSRHKEERLDDEQDY